MGDETVTVLNQMGFAIFLVTGALFVLIDTATGFSAALAKSVKLKKYHDHVLFVLTLAGSMLLLSAINHLFPTQGVALVHYIHLKDFVADLRQNRDAMAAMAAAGQYANVIIAAMLAAGVVAFVIAIRQRRPWLVWLPLSFLSNLGGIVWLLAGRRTAGFDDTPADLRGKKPAVGPNPYKYFAGTIFILIIGYLMFGNPDSGFRSSDGKWADSEVQFKGRDLKSIVFYFEEYKLACNAPKAVLLRSTPQVWYNIFAWPSYLTDKKWRVPLSDAHPEIGNYHEESCMNENGTTAVVHQAEKNADRYLDSL
jgi:hypothetical protein